MVERDGAGGGVEHEVFHDERGWTAGRCRGSAAAAYGSDAGEEFAGVEGLGHVIVCAHFEADNAVDVFTASGEEQHAVRGEGADLLEDFEAIDAGEHDVEEDHGPGAGACDFEAGIAAMDGGDVEVVAGEVFGEHVAELYVVVDEEDVFHALARVTLRAGIVRNEWSRGL